MKIRPYKISWKSVKREPRCSLRTDKHDEANSRFSLSLRKRLKWQRCWRGACTVVCSEDACLKVTLFSTAYIKAPLCTRNCTGSTQLLPLSLLSLSLSRSRLTKSFLPSSFYLDTQPINRKRNCHFSKLLIPLSLSLSLDPYIWVSQHNTFPSFNFKQLHSANTVFWHATP